MKRKRSILAILLVMVLISSVFVACKGRQSGSGDVTTFTLLVDHDRAVGEGWFVLYDVIEKETGIKVDLMVYPYQAAVEQKNIMLSTGDYPDAIGGWILSANDIMSLSAEGVIIPLENLMMNTTNVRACLELPGVRASMTLPDGHIYSPPYPVEEPLVTFNPWINKVWLDRVGLPVPQTTDEFRTALIAFRDQIGTVDGQRVIPFSGDANNFDLGILTGWWGVNAGGLSIGGFAVINNRIEITSIRPELRESIKFFAELYSQRLIDPELFTQDLATWQAKGKLGLYGSGYGYGPADWIPEVSPADKESDPSRNWGGWVPLPVLRAPGVTNPVIRNNNFGNSLFRTQFVITDKAGDARAANIMKWLDAMYEPVHAHENVWGPLGYQWEILSGNPAAPERDPVVWTTLDTSTSDRDYYERNDWGGYSVPTLPRYRRKAAGPDAIWIRQPRPGWENEYRDKDVADAMYRPFLETVPMPAIWYSEEDARRVADLQTPIGDYIKQKVAEWVSGQANVDAEWDAYVNQLNRMGIQELLEIRRNATGLK